MEDQESIVFHLWLKKHSNRLRMEGYGADEIAMLAVSCGFTVGVSCEGITNQVVHVKRMLMLWESPFLGQWLDLKAYENGRDREAA